MKFNDMLAPDPIHLPEDPATGCDLLADATAVAHPDSPAVWAARAERELADGDTIVAYAYARTGYHRSLDRLRANGWKGWGPVPTSHEANVPVLKAIAMLALASKAIGDDAEYDRCRQMLSDADPDSVTTLL
ncbi:hypothetical protein BJP05_08250 [Corynebacterium sp. NML98-0116]|uniref:DUF3151 domain-containing protein n=1 Tax=Corynebacterium TaxID=1716 RepID=UPI0008791D11|nr:MULTISPECIES: DUF3151 domain-containing protein [Corynebacterium]AOX06135.1 hypothetical protein BJP05_08250 [Corynebacterium sp. NML98-0116]MCQ4615659.1 DUF3151 domain-containing protein [Corynebacterium pseudogenitalium]UUA87765.1 DUF3151 domain-containing protein [Corynebacterium pseudogenitalium]